MYKIKTKNGLTLESPSIKDIMQELSNHEQDTPVKFMYVDGDRKVESQDIREFYSIVAEDKKEQEQEGHK